MGEFFLDPLWNASLNEPAMAGYGSDVDSPPPRPKLGDRGIREGLTGSRLNYATSPFFAPPAPKSNLAKTKHEKSHRHGQASGEDANFFQISDMGRQDCESSLKNISQDSIWGGGGGFFWTTSHNNGGTQYAAVGPKSHV